MDRRGAEWSNMGEREGGPGERTSLPEGPSAAESHEKERGTGPDRAGQLIATWDDGGGKRERKQDWLSR